MRSKGVYVVPSTGRYIRRFCFIQGRLKSAGGVTAAIRHWIGISRFNSSFVFTSDGKNPNLVTLFGIIENFKI